jgi:hypothetical protein
VGNWGALAIRMHHSRFTIYGGIAMIRETAIAAAFLGFFGGGIAQAAYTVCRSQLDGREYLICAPESCFPGDRSVGYNPGKHPRPNQFARFTALTLAAKWSSVVN